MRNSSVVKINCSLSLGDPNEGVAKYAEAHPAHRADNFKNYPHDTRHTVTTP